MPSDASTTATPSSPTSVRIVRRRSITCSDPNACSSLSPNDIFRLSPLDQLVLTFIPVAVVYLYAPPSVPRSDTPVIPIQALEEALAKVLNAYPHLTGRLAQDPSHGGAHLTHLDSGAEVLQAECDAPLSSFCADANKPNLLELPGMGEDLLAPYDFKAVSTDPDHQPVLTIQHTRFACGAVALGVRILHCLNDGMGFFQFINDLTEVYRSRSIAKEGDGNRVDKLQVALPYLRNYEVDTLDAEKKVARQYQPKLYYLEPLQQEEQPIKPEAESVSEQKETLAAPDLPVPVEIDSDTQPEAETENEAEPTSKTPITGQILHFSPTTLSKLRLLASPPSEQGGYTTTFDALTGFLHQRIYQARLRVLGSLGPLDLLCPIDLRKMLGLGERYPYNAVFTTSSPFTPSELGDDSQLPGVAKKVHDMVRPFSPSSSSSTSSSTTNTNTQVKAEDEVKSEVEWIAALGQDRSRMRHPYRGGSGAVMISQWNKMDMYGVGMFEQGVKPVLVAPPFTPISLHDGLGYLIPTAEGDGGIDVYLALREDVWPELDVGLE